MIPRSHGFDRLKRHRAEWKQCTDTNQHEASTHVRGIPGARTGEAISPENTGIQAVREPHRVTAGYTGPVGRLRPDKRPGWQTTHSGSASSGTNAARFGSKSAPRQPSGGEPPGCQGSGGTTVVAVATPSWPSEGSRPWTQRRLCIQPGHGKGASAYNRVTAKAPLHTTGSRQRHLCIQPGREMPCHLDPGRRQRGAGRDGRTQPGRGGRGQRGVRAAAVRAQRRGR